MLKGNPRLGRCLCGSAATVRDTRAEDGRLHFTCHDMTPEGKAKYFGFVGRSEAWRLVEDCGVKLVSVASMDERELDAANYEL